MDSNFGGDFVKFRVFRNFSPRDRDIFTKIGAKNNEFKRNVEKNAKMKKSIIFDVTCQHFELWAVQKCATFVDPQNAAKWLLGIYLQQLASIQRRTSLSRFGDPFYSTPKVEPIEVREQRAALRGRRSPTEGSCGVGSCAERHAPLFSVSAAPQQALLANVAFFSKNAVSSSWSVSK